MHRVRLATRNELEQVRYSLKNGVRWQDCQYAGLSSVGPLNTVEGTIFEGESVPESCLMSSVSSDESLLLFYRHLHDADKSEPALPPSIRAEIHHRFRDLLARLKEAIVRYWDPKTIREVRDYEPSLSGHALAYLITKAIGSPGRRSRKDMLQIDECREYLWDDETTAQRILADSSVRDVEDVIHWLEKHRRHKRRVTRRRPDRA
jgi:hypothetical protein